jgi:hypothetical protein
MTIKFGRFSSAIPFPIDRAIAIAAKQRTENMDDI